MVIEIDLPDGISMVEFIYNDGRVVKCVEKKKNKSA